MTAAERSVIRRVIAKRVAAALARCRFGHDGRVIPVYRPVFDPPKVEDGSIPRARNSSPRGS